MRILKTILFLFLSIVLKICFIPFYIIIFVLSTIEKILKITRLTTTYFIKQIESEVLKQTTL